MQTTTSIWKTSCGISSCSASGKASTNGLPSTKMNPNDDPFRSLATRESHNTIPVATSARA